MHRTDGRRLCALLTLLAALLLSGCVRTQPPDESDGGTARPDMPAPAPAVSAIDLAHATEEQLFYIGELTEALPALLEADRALTEIFVCGRLYLEGDYGAVDPYTPFPVEQGEKYADFAEITALFDDAFGAGGAGREEFLADPATAVPPSASGTARPISRRISCWRLPISLPPTTCRCSTSTPRAPRFTR